MENKVFLGERTVGIIREATVKYYSTYRDFYKHQYQLEQSFYFELELIQKLKKEGVTMVYLTLTHENAISNVHEKKYYFFPIKLIEISGLNSIHHNGYTKQIGIRRETLELFELPKK